MPQMSPIQWDSLYLLIIIFIMLIMTNFFFQKLNKTFFNLETNKKIKSTNINWLW